MLETRSGLLDGEPLRGLWRMVEADEKGFAPAPGVQDDGDVVRDSGHGSVCLPSEPDGRGPPRNPQVSPPPRLRGEQDGTPPTSPRPATSVRRFAVRLRNVG